MNTSQIRRVGKLFCDTDFKGVYAFDQFLRIPQLKRGGYIFNTDPSSLPGEHWVGVWVENGHQVQYFDTFGRGITDERLRKRFSGQHVVYNETVLQNITTIACGHHSLLFIGLRSVGWSMKRIVEHLSRESSSHIRDHRVVLCVEGLTQLPSKDRLGINIHVFPFSD